MKKVLFATTALVLSAGFASAEVALSGDGRMGMIYDGNDVQLSSRARVKFTLTGESDAGLSFGGAFRVDQENYKADKYRSAARGTGGAVWVSGAFGKLSMGDVLSASEMAIGDLYELGYTDGSFAYDVEEISYLTGDGVNLDQGPTALYEYTINNISLYASLTDGSDTNWSTTVGADTYDGDDPDTDAPSDSVAYSVAAKYEAENFWVALGYAGADVVDTRAGHDGSVTADEISLGAEGKFNNFSVKGVYLKYSDRYTGGAFAEELDQTYGLAMAYQMDAILIEGFYRRDEYQYEGASDENYDAYGIGAEYDLGGGATVAGAVIDSDYLDDTVVDMGVKFKF